MLNLTASSLRVRDLALGFFKSSLSIVQLDLEVILLSQSFLQDCGIALAHTWKLQTSKFAQNSFFIEVMTLADDQFI